MRGIVDCYQCGARQEGGKSFNGVRMMCIKKSEYSKKTDVYDAKKNQVYLDVYILLHAVSRVARI